MSPNKKAYYQGGGGVNEPTPGKKKYKSDPAIVVQPRFEEPFYHNYDLYDVPGKHGPGAGWHAMQNYKSVKEFLDARRKKLKDKYVADDSWIQDDGSKTKSPNKIKARANLLSKMIKTAQRHAHLECSNCGNRIRSCKCMTKEVDYVPSCEKCKGNKVSQRNFDLGKGLYENMDKYESISQFRHKQDSNDVDFPGDQYMDPAVEVGLGEHADGNNNLLGGWLDKYLPEDDFEGKPDSALNFGRNYENDEKSGVDLDELVKKYLGPDTSHGLYGLPDGVDLPDGDLGDPTNINPDYGTTDSGNTMYEDKWNI
jgi:hypothetical protein